MEGWWSCTVGAAFATQAEGGACNAALLDLTDPAAREWWWRQYPAFMKVGVDGFWTASGRLLDGPGRAGAPPGRLRHAGGLTVRVHNTYNLPTEPWGFGATAERIVRRYIDLRYRMLPYTYALARQNHETGTPLARPLFFVDPSDERLRAQDDAFMWGEAFLVAPVTQEGKRMKTVYLPRGTWTDYWTGEVHSVSGARIKERREERSGRGAGR